MIVNSSFGGGGMNLTGTTDQVVGFDANGKPTAVSKEKLKGDSGKTAYQYAVDGGYTGTEEEFQALMGTGPWLPLIGGTMTGPIMTGLNTKVWEAKSAGMYPTFSKPLTASIPSLSFQSRSNVPDAGERVPLQGIANPTYDSDAANKQYVDANRGISPVRPEGYLGPAVGISLNSVISITEEWSDTGIEVPDVVKYIFISTQLTRESDLRHFSGSNFFYTKNPYYNFFSISYGYAASVEFMISDGKLMVKASNSNTKGGLALNTSFFV